MPLIIVESPTKAKTLTRFLGGDFRIEATYGHVRDLPKQKLGIDIREVNSNFEFNPVYEIISERKKRVAELKKIAKAEKEIILATDPDREGEAIAYHVREILLKDIKKKIQETIIKRIVFHEITSTAINQALSNPGDIDGRLVDAQTARRLLDRLVGYKLSPLLWNKLGKRWLSAGRVQTVAVRLIVEREREIQAFTPEEYWLFDVEFKGDRDKFLARLEKIDGKRAEIKNKESADRILVKLKASEFKVSDIEVKEQMKSPSPPFTTSTLQQAAVNRFGWSAKKVMRAAQNLYEEGLITYHRTDSTNLAMEAVSATRKFIETNFGKDYLPEKFKFYKTKSRVAQEAHEAIRPTNVNVISPTDERKINLEGKKLIEKSVGRDGQLLYSLIWRRFLACQMTEALFTLTTITILGLNKEQDKITEFLLKTTTQQVKFDGFLRLYDKKNEDLVRSPNVVKDEKLQVANIIPQQKFTEPPSRYNEASLIKALEEKGIGRPSTYAPIISTIELRKYVEKIERRFKPTDLGFAVCDFLIKYFPKIFDVTFTAGMEEALDEIANGRKATSQVLNDFYAPFKLRLDEVFKEAERVKLNLGETNEKCPKCASPLVIRLSRFGKFLACSTYPTCKFTKNILEKTGINCPKCGGDMVVKRTRRGKQFYGCSNWPKCNFAAWKKEDIK